MLTLRIKPNDEVSLKYDLRSYVTRIKGIKPIAGRSKCKNCCQDPNYILTVEDLVQFRSKTVVVTFAETRASFNEEGSINNFYYYIHVRDRSGNEAEFPIEFIDRNRNLKRDHKRISLHNKTLICG